MGSQKTDVARRYFVESETAAEMGAKAAAEALENAGLRFSDIDCLVCTSGTMQQPIPCTAAFIQKAMGQEQSGVPAFDINSTCLSFVTGLNVMSYMVHAGRYRRVLLVATEIASKGLSWSNKESAALFGDGAAAVVLEKAAREEDKSGMLYPIECNPRATSGVHLFRKEDGLQQAIVQSGSPTVILQPQANTKVMLAMPMLGYGLAADRSWNGLDAWLRSFASARDAVFRWNDPLPFLSQIPMLVQFSLISRNRGISLMEATTADIEWNGES